VNCLLICRIFSSLLAWRPTTVRLSSLIRWPPSLCLSNSYLVKITLILNFFKVWFITRLSLLRVSSIIKILFIREGWLELLLRVCWSLRWGGHRLSCNATHTSRERDSQKVTIILKKLFLLINCIWGRHHIPIIQSLVVHFSEQSHFLFELFLSHFAYTRYLKCQHLALCKELFLLAFIIFLFPINYFFLVRAYLMLVRALFIQALTLLKKELAVLCPSERCPDMPAVPNTLVYR